jgi:pimeloyl-ACP methyl ester carboxylesterase
MSENFFHRQIDIEGASISCFDGGEGDPIVTLHGEHDTVPSALEKLLSQKFRVIALRSPAHSAQLVAQATATLGLGRYALIAGTAATAVALRHGLEGPAQIETLVLVSPSGRLDDLEARLGDIRAATLILVGASAKPTPSTARLCADRIPEAYLMLVYDGGPAMENDRPAALFEAIADFIERRGRFILERQESALSP